MTADPTNGALLSVRDLRTYFSDRQGVISRLRRHRSAPSANASPPMPQ